MELKKIELKDFNPAIFDLFGTRTPLLTAGDRSGCNTMTIGWGQLGRIWRVPTCTVYVKHKHFTHQFMENSDYFTVSILPEGMKEALDFCGNKSGRDVDKFAVCGLSVAYGVGDAPYIAEAETVLVCRKIYAQDMDPACIVDDGPIARFYTDEDYHCIYTGQVMEVYQR